jgi:hypothetical protein
MASTFSQRLERRRRIWWDDHRGLRSRAHRFWEIHAHHSREDPEQKWKCCSWWQRKLINKWNAREFASSHGCRVPQLYWRGRAVGALPLHALPRNFVIRPAWLQGSRGVRVVRGDRELLDGRAVERGQLKSELRREAGAISPMPYLVEEFLRTEQGEYELPLDYKFFMFGEAVGAIVVVDRRSRTDWRNVAYTPEWELTPEPILTADHPRADPKPRPRCFEQMVAWARTLGRAYETFVRVDLYATDGGCVFGEFCCAPASGIFTDYAESHFDCLWREAFGDTV